MYMYVKILVIFRFDFWILYVCIALMYVYSHIWCVFSKAYVQHFVNQKKSSLQMNEKCKTQIEIALATKCYFRSFFSRRL